MDFLRGDSYHNSIILEIAPSHEKRPNPFKMNLEWMKEEEFINNIK